MAPKSRACRPQEASTRRSCARSSCRNSCPTKRSRGIARALELYAFCQSLGIAGPSLAKLLPRDFAGLNSAAHWLLGVLKIKYPDQAARDKNILPHTEALNERRRDALCDFIIARAA